MVKHSFNLNLLGALLPTWNFFDEIAAGPRLEVRIEAGEWLPVVASAPRGPLNLLINAKGTEHLLAVTAVERLLEEAQDYLDRPQDFAHTVTYRLCLAVARQEARPGQYFQFRVLTSDGSRELCEAFLSQMHRN